MNYVEFKEEVLKGLKKYLPDEYKNYNIEIVMVPKINGLQEALIISREGHSAPTPNIYLRQLYEQYKICNDIEKVLKFAVEFYMYGVNYGKAMTACMDMDGRDDSIIMMLINTDNNKEMLSTVPHRAYMDLSIIYRWLYPLPDGSFNLATISNEMLQHMGKNEEDLYVLALENTKRILPAHVETIGEDVNVISNDRGIIGAAVLIYGEELKNIADMMESDLYIIPSSIHEILTVPVSSARPDNLRKMIAGANRTVLKENDILSDSLYYYSRIYSEVTIVNDAALLCL